MKGAERPRSAVEQNHDNYAGWLRAYVEEVKGDLDERAKLEVLLPDGQYVAPFKGWILCNAVEMCLDFAGNLMLCGSRKEKIVAVEMLSHYKRTLEAMLGIEKQVAIAANAQQNAIDRDNKYQSDRGNQGKTKKKNERAEILRDIIENSPRKSNGRFWKPGDVLMRARGRIKTLVPKTLNNHREWIDANPKGGGVLGESVKPPVLPACKGNTAGSPNPAPP